MLAVAHRAGNDLAALRRALDAGVDLVEADVRYFRGALEVRHLKTLGPALLWDHPWELVRRRDARFPVLAEVLTELSGGSRLLLVTFRATPSSWPGRRRAFGVSVRRPLLTAESVAELHRSVGRVLTWPVDTHAELDHAVTLGVSGVIGQNLDLLRDVSSS